MNQLTARLYTGVLQFSIIFFTFALVWFSFVYYPKVVDQYKNGRIAGRPFARPAIASSSNFPIETVAFRLVYEPGSGNYYAFIEGKTLNEYLENKNSAQLALKTALSVENLCSFNIIYTSAEKLEIPKQYKTSSNCP